MLKFFRKYMKYILTLFVALLMIAFLIEPTLRMFGPDPAGEVIGTIGTDRIKLGDQRQASAQLHMLEQISPVLLQLGGIRASQGQAALQWMLMLHDAESMGLSASTAEVDQLLTMIGRNGTELSNLARQIGVSKNQIRKAVENWIVIQSYKELTDGLVHVPVAQRLIHWSRAGQYFQTGNYQGVALEIESAIHGALRLSESLLERFLNDLWARVTITAAVIPCDQYLSKVTPPEEHALVELFDRYKESLPGQSKPHGLGYRIPDRVKIEYLTVPFDRIRDKVRIEEADALGYYDGHREEFRSPPAATQPGDDQSDDDAPIKPYEQVRSEIIDQLKDQQATERVDRIIKAAQAALLEDARGLGEQGSYRVVPDDWQPIDLDRVAQQLQQRFGVLPDVHRYDDRWLAGSQLVQLPGIGNSQVVVDQKTSPFLQYVLSERTLLGADGDHPLGTLRLQERLPSVPVVSADGGRHLFRLIDTEASRVPASMSEVRDQVMRDAQRIGAYQLLKEETQTWLEQARAEGIEQWASKQGLSIHQPPPFPKRRSGFDGHLQVPNIPGLGNGQALVDGIFDLVDRVIEANPVQTATPDGGIEQVPAAQRIGTIAADQEMNLILVRIDQLQPMSRRDFEDTAQDPRVRAWINQSLLGPDRPDSLSIEALSKRVGFEPAYKNDEPGEDTTANNKPKPDDAQPSPPVS